jgi:hypothetical protein
LKIFQSPVVPWLDRNRGVGATVIKEHPAAADEADMDQRFWKGHPHLAWDMWGLDEIEATLASIESRLGKHLHAHTEARSAVADMRTVRDALRKTIAEHRQANTTASTKAAVEGHWHAFEDSVQAYLEAVDKQVTEQESVFRARADAQNRTWQQAIDQLHINALSLATDRQGNIERAVKRLESEAVAAKSKLDTLNKAEGASWAAMKSALTETRAALDRAHRAVIEGFERTAGHT